MFLYNVSSQYVCSDEHLASQARNARPSCKVSVVVVVRLQQKLECVNKQFSNTATQNFMQIRSPVFELLHADRQTDIEAWRGKQAHLWKFSL